MRLNAMLAAPEAPLTIFWGIKLSTSEFSLKKMGWGGTTLYHINLVCKLMVIFLTPKTSKGYCKANAF